MLREKLLRAKQLMTFRGFLAQLMRKDCAHSACKLFLFLFNKFFNTVYRATHSQAYGYSIKTSTSSLRTHLLKSHMNEWLSECKRLNIIPRGKEGEEARAKVTGLPVQHLAKARVAFTQQSFINALVQFIVATNQVFFLIFF
jgi:hypothetical protein